MALISQSLVTGITDANIDSIDNTSAQKSHLQGFPSVYALHKRPKLSRVCLYMRCRRANGPQELGSGRISNKISIPSFLPRIHSITNLSVDYQLISPEIVSRFQSLLIIHWWFCAESTVECSVGKCHFSITSGLMSERSLASNLRSNRSDSTVWDHHMTSARIKIKDRTWVPMDWLTIRAIVDKVSTRILFIVIYLQQFAESSGRGGFGQCLESDNRLDSANRLRFMWRIF